MELRIRGIMINTFSTTAMVGCAMALCFVQDRAQWFVIVGLLIVSVWVWHREREHVAFVAGFGSGIVSMQESRYPNYGHTAEEGYRAWRSKPEAVNG